MRHAACTWERGSDMGLAERAARARATPHPSRASPSHATANRTHTLAIPHGPCSCIYLYHGACACII